MLFVIGHSPTEISLLALVVLLTKREKDRLVTCPAVCESELVCVCVCVRLNIYEKTQGWREVLLTASFFLIAVLPFPQMIHPLFFLPLVIGHTLKHLHANVVFR